LSLQEQLKKWLIDAGRVAIIGIGNPLRGDDGLGPLVIQKLKKENLPKNVKLFNCGATPETFTSHVKRFQPTHIIMVDSAHLNIEVGEAKLVSAENIGGLTVSTHNLPLNLFAEYLQEETKAEIILLAVQPKKIDYNTEITSELRKAAERLSEDIREVFRSKAHF